MANRRLPYMPFWVDDYERDTRHLKTAEHGAYLLLLMAAWKSPSNALPDDDEMLARIAGVSSDQWAKMKRIVMAFWTLDGRSKKWVQKRLKKERRLAVDRKAKAGDAAASRWNKTKKHNAKAMLDECHPFITTIETPNGVSERAGARKKPKGWFERKTHSQAFNELNSRIDEHDGQGRIEKSVGSAGEPVQLLPASRAG